MTVTRNIDAARTGGRRTYEDMVEKHWGLTRTVVVERELAKSIGINIVGGKVRFRKM